MFVPYLFSHNIPPLPIYNKLWCAQGVVEDSGNILTYDTDLAEMNFRAGVNPRICLPRRLSVQYVPRITCVEFTKKFEGGTATYELMWWHRNAAGVPFSTPQFERPIFASFRRPMPHRLTIRTYIIAFWLFGVEMPIVTGAPLVRSAPQNDEGVGWYHDRVKRWIRNAILHRMAEHGPFWDANRRGWRFRHEGLIVISENGIEDMSPIPVPPVVLAIPAVTPR
ncbi:unnamed protein product [Closterium sp. NIES-53]